MVNQNNVEQALEEAVKAGDQKKVQEILSSMLVSGEIEKDKGAIILQSLMASIQTSNILSEERLANIQSLQEALLEVKKTTGTASDVIEIAKTKKELEG